MASPDSIVSRSIQPQSAKYHRTQFDTLGAWLETARLPARQEWCMGEPSRNSSHSHGPSTDWDYSAGWDGAVQLARTGWAEGAKRVRELAATVSAAVTSSGTLLPQPRFDVTGEYVDVGRYVDGDPECMVQEQLIEAAGSGKIVKLLANMTVSAAVDARVIEQRGAAVVALVDCLERAGRRVELWTGIGETDGGLTQDMLVCLKRAQDPFDVDALAFMLAHPAAFRRLGFGIIEQTTPDAWASSFRRGYGIPSELREPADISIGCARYGDRDWNNPETCAAWIRQQLTAQGIELEGAS